MKLERLTEILLELRAASKQLKLDYSEDKGKALMLKYNMIFFDKNMNEINSRELRDTLDAYFHETITNDELNELIPIACKALKMQYAPSVDVNSVIDCYDIILW